MENSQLPIHTIALFPKVQADTAIAVYLLKAFGEEYFPGIQQASLVFITTPQADVDIKKMEQEGTLLVDLGGMFDHHLENERLGRREECVSTIIAKYLKIEDHPALKQLLAWAKRDDLEGKGTISRDSLDRAFGLSGIISNLNRQFINNPQYILDLLLPIIDAHVKEQIHRKILMPQEWEVMLENGKAEIHQISQGSAELEVALISSDNIALPGFIRAAKNIALVIQRRGTGHTNLITQQKRGVDLRPVIEEIRLAEAKKKGLILPPIKELLQAPGRLDDVGEWYYDTAANTIQNGGISPEGTPVTKLTKEEIMAAVKDSLPRGHIGSANRK